MDQLKCPLCQRISLFYFTADILSLYSYYKCFNIGDKCGLKAVPTDINCRRCKKGNLIFSDKSQFHCLNCCQPPIVSADSLEEEVKKNEIFFKIIT